MDANQQMDSDSPGELRGHPAWADGIIFGPVPSRRFGQSLGINLLPGGRRTCTFACGYCQLGGTGAPPSYLESFPDVATVEESLSQVLGGGLAMAGAIDVITLAGNGEPTLHPGFPEIVDRLLRVRERLAPDVPMVLLTNGTELRNVDVRRAIQRVDRAYYKLDAVDEQVFQLVNRPNPEVHTEELIGRIAAMREPRIQALFVGGPADNQTESAIESWLVALEMIQPVEVQITTISRPPEDHEFTTVTEERLMEIAGRVRERIETEVHAWGP